jgi:linoleoyl-CoA desaturase
VATIDEAMRGEMARLWVEFRRRGFDRPATGRVLLTWAYNLGLTFGGLAGWFVFDSWWLKAAALLVSSVGFTGLTTCAHTAAHVTALPWRRANSVLAYFGYPFMAMLSVHYWRNKHNYVHHPTPNVTGTDDDCDLMPFFAMNESEVQSAGPLRRAYYRHVQGWIFPIVLTMNGFNAQRQGWTFLVKRLLDRRTRRPAHWIDLGVMLAHVAVWIVLPCVVLGVTEGLVLYFLRIGLMGYAMFFAFAPAHFPAEADLLEPAARERDFVMRQTQATVNFRTGVLGRLACNGVEYQIEHHLFPGICDVHYAQIAPLVREFCERNGYPYRTFGWGEGILKSYSALFHPRPIRRMAEPHNPLPAPEAVSVPV